MTISKPMFPPSIVPGASPTSRRSILFGLAAGVVASPAVASSIRPAVKAPAAETALSGLPPAATTASEVDPIFAVIAEHRAHMRDWADAMDAEHEAESDEEDKAATAAIDAASDAFESSIGVVLTAQPTTIAGVAALLEHVGQEEFLGMSSGGDERDHYETVLTTWVNTGREDPRKRIAQDFPIRLAATVRAMAGTATVRRIEPSEPDPIYAAIAEHRQAVKAEARALEDTFGFGGGPAEEPEDSPAHVAAEERHSTASDRTQAAVWKLVEIEPTSAAGLRALMQYVVSIEPGLQWPPGWEREFHKACLRSTEALIDGVRT
jgi:hypothetical protein